MKKLFETGPRPDFITDGDISRWESKLKQLATEGTIEQQMQVESLESFPPELGDARESFYAGEWLGEQLREQGVAHDQCRVICYQHGQRIGQGAQAWPEACQIAGVKS